MVFINKLGVHPQILAAFVLHADQTAVTGISLFHQGMEFPQHRALRLRRGAMFSV